MGFLRKIKYLLRPRTRFNQFTASLKRHPGNLAYAFRRALGHEVVLPVVLRTPTGARLSLSSDPIDENIARDLIFSSGVFFPDLTGIEGAVLNIGGHHGLWAAEALARYPRRRIGVVEPNADWAGLIDRNLALNGGLGRAVRVSVGLGDAARGATLRFDPNSSWGASAKAQAEGAVAVSVQLATLDQILERAGISDLALLYCNAEGAEYDLIPQLEAGGLRPRVLALMLHPEFGDPADLDRRIQALGYEKVDKTKVPNRPVIHYIHRGKTE